MFPKAITSEYRLNLIPKTINTFYNFHPTNRIILTKPNLTWWLIKFVRLNKSEFVSMSSTALRRIQKVSYTLILCISSMLWFHLLLCLLSSLRHYRHLITISPKLTAWLFLHLSLTFFPLQELEEFVKNVRLIIFLSHFFISLLFLWKDSVESSFT